MYLDVHSSFPLPAPFSSFIKAAYESCFLMDGDKRGRTDLLSDQFFGLGEAFRMGGMKAFRNPPFFDGVKHIANLRSSGHAKP